MSDDIFALCKKLSQQHGSCKKQNLPGKLEQQSAICWNSLGLYRDYGLNNIFFRDKNFVFQDRKLKLSRPVEKRISYNLTKFQLFQLIHTIFIYSFSILCEVSRIFLSSRWWKFQLCILKNKKVLLIKKYYLGRSLQVTKRVPTDGVFSPNFQ